MVIQKKKEKKRAFGLSNFVPAINKHIDNGSFGGQR